MQSLLQYVCGTLAERGSAVYDDGDGKLGVYALLSCWLILCKVVLFVIVHVMHLQKSKVSYCIA